MHTYALSVFCTFQANGLVERFNQTIQGMLVKFIAEKKESWEDYLDTCVYAYNTSRHESSLFTPFQLMFGRRAVLPIELDKDTADKNGVDVETIMGARDDDAVQESLDARQKQLEEAKTNIVAAQKKQKEIYDRKHHHPEVFSVGAVVLKKDFLRKKRKGGKLDAKWVGPYKIAKSLGKGLYRLECVNESTKVISRVNGVHLKPYLSSEVCLILCLFHSNVLGI